MTNVIKLLFNPRSLIILATAARSLSVVFAVSAFPFSIVGQESDLVYGEIPPADRFMKSYEPDTSASAVVLGEVAQMYFVKGDRGYEYSLHIHRRVKLLRSKAFDAYSAIAIPYYHYDDLESAKVIKAQTITPAGQIYPVENKDIFTERVNDRWSRISFTFPKLEEGAIVEYVSVLTSRDIVQPRTWFFQESIPVRLSVLKLFNNLPATFVTLFEGGDYLKKVKEDKEGTWMAHGPTTFLAGENLFRMVNSPALKKEAFITTMEDYRVRVRLQMSEVIHAGGFKEQILSTWEKAAGNLNINENFGAFYHKKRFFKQLAADLEPIVAPLASPKEKMEAIYQFISENVRYNDRDGVFPRRNPDEAYLQREATSAELNIMLLAMLKNFGINAHPLLTSTRDHGRLIQSYPIMDQFNYVMAHVDLDGEIRLLDATNPRKPSSLPSARALNHFGWVADPDKPVWIKIEMLPSTDIYAGKLTLSANGALDGVVRATYTAYSALDEREKYFSDKKGTYWKNRLDGWVPELRLDSVVYLRAEEWKKDFINTLYFHSPEGAVSTGDYLYFPPVVYSGFRENPLQLNERTYPIDLPYPFIEQYNMTLHLPDNYVVEEMPENVDIQLPDDTGSFKLEIKRLADNRLHFIYSFSLLKTRISPNLYQDVKKMFDALIQKQGEQIVLKRKS